MNDIRNRKNDSFPTAFLHFKPNLLLFMADRETNKQSKQAHGLRSVKPNGVHLGLWRAERLDCETDVSSSKKWQVCVAVSLPCVPGAGASLPEPPGEDVPSPRSWKHWRCWRKKYIYVKRHYILLFRANATPKKSQLGMREECIHFQM